ncbi:MAG TPA: hypothetical protein VII20_17935, partial [Roseiarcus sp.]
EAFEVKDDGEAVAASGGDHFVIVLEFECLSRIIASMQSMRWCRHDPAAVSCVFEPGQSTGMRTRRADAAISSTTGETKA